MKIFAPMVRQKDQWAFNEIYDALDNGRVIADNAVLTIASWFRSTVDHGLVFAKLVSSGVCDDDELLAAIDIERSDFGHTGKTLRALNALEAWVKLQVG